MPARARSSPRLLATDDVGIVLEGDGARTYVAAVRSELLASYRRFVGAQWRLERGLRAALGYEAVEALPRRAHRRARSVRAALRAPAYTRAP